MANLNTAHLIGRLGKDPEMRFTPNGNPVTTFSVAINSYYTDKDGNKIEDTDWINIECWGKTAEAVNEYVTKGSQVYVEGRIKTDTWEDKESGERKYRTFIRANNVQFLDPKNSTGDQGSQQDDRPRQASRQQAAPTRQAASAPRRNAPQPISDDDIPF